MGSRRFQYLHLTFDREARQHVAQLTHSLTSHDHIWAISTLISRTSEPDQFIRRLNYRPINRSVIKFFLLGSKIRANWTHGRT